MRHDKAEHGRARYIPHRPKFQLPGFNTGAVLGLTNAAYNTTSTLQFIPNMDGFPNGRRLEDDVTTIELQAVSGVVLAAIGLWYDDYTGTGSAVTPDLTNVLGFNAGITHNDTTFKSCFPYLQDPWRGFTGTGYVGPVDSVSGIRSLGLSAPLAAMNAYPNPFTGQLSVHYKLDVSANVSIAITDITGRVVKVFNEGSKTSGDYIIHWDASGLNAGTFIVNLIADNQEIQSIKLVKTN